MTPLGFERKLWGCKTLPKGRSVAQLVRADVYALSQNWVYPVPSVRKNHKLGRFVLTEEHATRFRPWCLWCLLRPEIGAIYAEELKHLQKEKS